MTIKVNTDGSLELVEKKKPRFSANHMPMNSSNHNILVNNVRNQRSNSGRRTIILNAFNTSNNYFTSQQIVQLLQLINGESYRLELAKSSYRNVTDPANFSRVGSMLNTAASKNELNDYVNNFYYSDEEYNPNPSIPDNNNSGYYPNNPMPEAQYNSLYQTIQMQFFPSEKMNSLTNAFNTVGNYFSTTQAKKLIEMVTAESNRLQLAKLSYKIITDRDNFTNLYVLLESQSSRNEFDTYIKGFRE